VVLNPYRVVNTVTVTSRDLVHGFGAVVWLDDDEWRTIQLAIRADSTGGSYDDELMTVESPRGIPASAGAECVRF
jgi:hypothetical protein